MPTHGEFTSEDAKLDLRQQAPDWSYGLGFIVCLLGGCIFAFFFVIVAVPIYLLGGPEGIAADVSLSRLIIVMSLGFIFSGMAAGAINPLAKTKPGAILAGTVAIVPMTLASIIVLTGRSIPHDPSSVFAFFATTLTLGPYCGLLGWRELHR